MTTSTLVKMSLISLAAGAFGVGPADAQLAPDGSFLSGAPIRVQVGNGPALIGNADRNVAVGVSVLSKSYGTTGPGTSVRLLGTEKVAGVDTPLVKPNGKPLYAAVVSPAVQGVTSALVK